MFRIFHTPVAIAAAGLAIGLCVSPRSADAGDFRVAHAFTASEGYHPYAGLVSDAKGNMFGAQSSGGTGCAPFGCGTIFKMAPGGSVTVLYQFLGGNDGASPVSTLVRDKQGNLYGTTTSGGSSGCGGNGCGTVFELTPDGQETLLHAFTGGTDGQSPYGGLAIDRHGNLFGTAFGGGNAGCGEHGGCGTVFEITSGGAFSVLHAFTAGSDGAFPNGGATVDAHGDVYGTTEAGGGGNCQNGDVGGCGAIFEIGAGGAETVLYAFTGAADGDFPEASPIVDKAGNLYGTTFFGGSGQCQCGTVYELAPGGALTVLHTFAQTDGALPYGSLLRDTSGTLYGTTEEGGRSCRPGGCGVVFALAPDGTETVLHAFNETTDGHYPDSAPIMDKKGNLYGTATWGGNQSCSNGCGTVFEVKLK